MGQCYNSVVVTASPEDVWKALKNFHDLSWAPNVITSVEKIGDKPGLEIGARRKLNGAFLETLIELDDEKRTFRYTIDDGPGPVAPEVVEKYVGSAALFPVTTTGETFVLWKADYESKDDDAVGEFCNPIYQALLTDLAKTFAT